MQLYDPNNGQIFCGQMWICRTSILWQLVAGGSTPQSPGFGYQEALSSHNQTASSGNWLADMGGVATTPVKAYEVDTYSALVSRSLVGDGLDIHHVAQKHPAYQVIDGYDQKDAPSIALPRAEHTAIPTIRGEFTDTARSLLAKDIWDLRIYTNAPAESMHQLLKLNKEKYKESLSKK